MLNPRMVHPYAPLWVIIHVDINICLISCKRTLPSVNLKLWLILPIWFAPIWIGDIVEFYFYKVSSPTPWIFSHYQPPGHVHTGHLGVTGKSSAHIIPCWYCSSLTSTHRLLGFGGHIEVWTFSANFFVPVSWRSFSALLVALYIGTL